MFGIGKSGLRGLFLIGAFLLLQFATPSQPALAQSCPDGSSAPCAEDPALDGCTACHGYQIVGGNRDGSDRWIWLSSGAVRHQIAPKRSDWTSNVQSMINKGARSSLEVTAGYLNTNYCPTCAGLILGSPVPTNVTDISATVSWSTSANGFEDEPSDAVLYYGTDEADVLLGPGCGSCQALSDPNPAANHLFEVTGLLPNTQYFFVNQSTSALGTVRSTYAVPVRTKRAAGVCEPGAGAVPSRIFATNVFGTSGSKLAYYDPETNGYLGQSRYGSSFGPQEVPGELAASPDGARIYLMATTGSDGPGPGAVMDAYTIDEFGTVAFHSSTRAGLYGFPPNLNKVAGHPDGVTAYVSYGGTLQKIDTDAGSIVETITVPCNATYGLGVHPDGSKVFMACHGGGDRLLTIDTGTSTVINTATFTADTLSTRESNALGISPDGSAVYLAQGALGLIRVFDGTTGALTGTITSLPAGSSPRAVAVTPDGSRLYAADPLGSHIVDLADMSLVVTLTGAPGTDVDIHPAGSFAYIRGNPAISVVDTATNATVAGISAGLSSNDLQGHVIISPGNPGEECPLPSVPPRLYLSERGRTTQLAVIDPEFSEEVAAIPLLDDPGELAAHPDGRRLYVTVGYEDLAVVDVLDNFILDTLTGVSELFPHLVSSPDGSRLYLVHRTASPAQLEIKVFDTTDSTAPVLISTHTDPVMSGCYTPLGLGIHPDGSKLYTICRSSDTAVPDRFFVMDIASGGISQTATVPRDVGNIPFVNAMDVAPDGSRVFFARAHTSPATVEIFDGATGANAGTVALPANALPRALAVSLDGTRLYVADQRLGTHVIDLETDTLLKTLTATQSRGLDLAVTPDGTRLYISLASSLFVWDTATETWLETIKGSFRSAYSIAITPGTP